MTSKFHSIFLASVAAGAIGLAIGDTISNGSSGGIGFTIGLLSSFAFLTFLAAVSEAGKLRVEKDMSEFIKSQTLATITQHQKQSATITQHQEQVVKHGTTKDTNTQVTTKQ